ALAPVRDFEKRAYHLCFPIVHLADDGDFRDGFRLLCLGHEVGMYEASPRVATAKPTRAGAGSPDLAPGLTAGLPFSQRETCDRPSAGASDLLFVGRICNPSRPHGR